MEVSSRQKKFRHKERRAPHHPYFSRHSPPTRPSHLHTLAHFFRRKGHTTQRSTAAQKHTTTMSADFLHEVCPDWEPDEFKIPLSDEPRGPLRDVDLKCWFNKTPDLILQNNPEDVSVHVPAHLRTESKTKSLCAHLRPQIHSSSCSAQCANAPLLFHTLTFHFTG